MLPRSHSRSARGRASQKRGGAVSVACEETCRTWATTTVPVPRELRGRKESDRLRVQA